VPIPARHEIVAQEQSFTGMAKPSNEAGSANM
jgi:hypothetical protein